MTHEDFLYGLVKAADAALNGDSNDAEHDALLEIRDALAAHLGLAPFIEAEDAEEAG